MSDCWQISPDTVKQRIDDGEDLHFVDCRTDAEWRRAHLGSAILLPLQELSLRCDELEPLRDKHVIVYCRTGHRSRIVARFLVHRGFTNVLSLGGGLEAWTDQIDPTFDCCSDCE
jgi:rhodanese-related sulfurtransferase